MKVLSQLARWLFATFSMTPVPQNPPAIDEDRSSLATLVRLLEQEERDNPT